MAFIGSANARYRPECARRIELARQAERRRSLRASDPAWRARTIAAQAERERQARLRGWPVPCSVCRRPVPMFRGRRKTGALCLRCRQEAPRWRKGERTAVHASKLRPRRRGRPLGAWSSHLPWSARDDAEIARAWPAGEPAAAIARRVRRTPDAVASRAQKLRLRRPARGARIGGDGPAAAAHDDPAVPAAG